MANINKLSEYVESRWKFFHEEATQGRIHENGIARLGSDVALAVKKLEEGRAAGPLEVEDIIRADVSHRFHLDHFQFSRRQIEEVREYLRELSRTADAEGAEFNRFVTQMLAYANGAAALGGLAYLGSRGINQPLAGIVFAIAVAVGGFSAALMSAYLLAIVNRRIGGRYRSGTFPNKTNDEIYQSVNQKLSWIERSAPPVFGWISAFALLGSAAIAFVALT